ncbi:MAG: protein-disulfide reductase DsbD N-terminal domain-containing protein, partial [Undibacterium sp.]|nr:protein-disulfide reductase DsbD N-terminal domain-containing protein [Undibacterium sp.]
MNNIYKNLSSFLVLGPRKISLALGTILMIVFSQIISAEDFLDPEVAFKVSAKMIEPGLAEVHFVIADGYYLYRERLKFESAEAKLGIADLPRGKVKFDETFQKEVETYRNSLIVRIPLQSASDFTLNVGRQGCADLGLCYPPMETPIRLSIGSSSSM